MSDGGEIFGAAPPVFWPGVTRSRPPNPLDVRFHRAGQDALVLFSPWAWSLGFHAKTGSNYAAKGGLRISPVLFSKIYNLKEYSLSFTTRTLLYNTIFLNPPRASYSKFILCINYHPYFIIFPTTNFFSLIPISTTIL
jgi:hypothetical protein